MKLGLRMFSVCVLVGLAVGAAGQENLHGRKWKPLPPLAHVVVEVHKGFNDKPLANAAVIFRATRDGKNDGNLEVKTDPDGKAAIDIIEVGSHVQLQVIAYGFATYAAEFDVTEPQKDLLIKMVRPRAQVSVYQDTEGKASERSAGVQEPPHPVKKAGTPAQQPVPGILQPAAPDATPATTTPATTTPATTAPATTAPSTAPRQ